MPTPPTFVAEYGDVFNSSTSPKTASVTVAAGDVLVIYALAETSTTINTPTGGGLTYNLQQSFTTSNFTAVFVWTASASSSQTFTLSVTCGGGIFWGFDCLRFSGSSGIGASAVTSSTSGAPSLGITTTQANSAIVVASGDWNAASGSSRTWRTVNAVTPSAGNGLETSYFSDPSHYTIYGAYYSDAGTAGSKTVGLSAPSGQKYAIIAVEVLGAAGGSTVDGTATIAGAGTVSATAVQNATASVAGAGTLAATAVQQATASPSGAGALTASVVQQGTVSPSGAATLSATATQGATAAFAGSGALSAVAVQRATAGLTGAGVLAATGSSSGGATASLISAGTLTATATQRSTVTVAGAGTVAVAATQNGKATPTGAGVLGAAGVIAGAAAITGAGALTSTVRQLAGSSLTGAGVLSASAGGAVTGTAALVGAGVLAINLNPCTTLRPFSGTTAHLVTVTPRPDTGITENPC